MKNQSVWRICPKVVLPPALQPFNLRSNYLLDTIRCTPKMSKLKHATNHALRLCFTKRTVRMRIVRMLWALHN